MRMPTRMKLEDQYQDQSQRQQLYSDLTARRRNWSSLERTRPRNAVSLLPSHSGPDRRKRLSPSELNDIVERCGFVFAHNGYGERQ